MAAASTNPWFQSLERQAELSVTHLAGLIGDNGKFVYHYQQRPSRPLPGYNILRHCGAIWALQQALLHDVALPGPRNAVAAAIERLCSRHLAFTGTGSAFIFERNSIKLGACGLALLVLAFSKGDCPIGRRQIMQSLIRYVREQEQSGGGFVHKREKRTLEQLPFLSDYYTGEALLGLLAAGVSLGDGRAIDYGLSAVVRLAEQGVGITEQSHWMMYAAEAANAIQPNRVTAAYMGEIGSSILCNPNYRARGACTPIACRTEALLSVARVSPGDPPVDDHKHRMTIDAIEQNLRLQMTCAREDGAFTRYPASQDVRIDFIQHNLLCLIGYQRLSKARSEPRFVLP